MDRDMRANSPRRTAKAAHVTSNDRQDKMKAVKMMNAMDSQNSGLNRILNRRLLSWMKGIERLFGGQSPFSTIYIYGYSVLYMIKTISREVSENSWFWIGDMLPAAFCSHSPTQPVTFNAFFFFPCSGIFFARVLGALPSAGHQPDLISQAKTWGSQVRLVSE